MIYQAVFDTAETLYRKGVQHVVLSPGSRNAPLTLSFSRHPKLKRYSIIDERSAGFIALGIAQNTKSPVVICCTSGTALLNYLPAIAEAYYQQIPLIIISADRPPEWIDQRDGQTINQVNAASNFLKGFYQMPVSLDHPDASWEYNRKLNEAYNQCNGMTKGPVHINVPFREPFYPKPDQKLAFSKEIRIINTLQNSNQIAITDEMAELWKSQKKKLIVVSQHEPDRKLKALLKEISTAANIPVVTDLISNMNDAQFIQYQDHFLAKLDKKQAEALRPDLLITCGKSVISKNLKTFLRQHKPVHHWHFENTSRLADTFQSVTMQIKHPIKNILDNIADLDTEITPFDEQIRSNYCQSWTVPDQKVKKKIDGLVDTDFSEYKASYLLSEAIPKDHSVHLANSMPVRYANLIRLIHPEVKIYCNRGTSGIDGTNGTAVGHALSTDQNVVLWTGDLSFFYDRNAFFHQHDIPNLKVIVMNNQGGGIFRLINGPKSLPELESYFETRHTHSAQFMAREFGFEYHSADNEESLNKGLAWIFSENQGKKILEVFTDPSKNEEVYNSIKNTNYE